MVCPPLAQPVLDAGGSATTADRAEAAPAPSRTMLRSGAQTGAGMPRKQRGGSALVLPQKQPALLRMLCTPSAPAHIAREGAGRTDAMAALLPQGPQRYAGTWLAGTWRCHESGAPGRNTGQHPALSTPQTPPAHICTELRRLPPVSTIPLCGKGSTSPDSHPPTVPQTQPGSWKTRPCPGRWHLRAQGPDH